MDHGQGSHKTHIQKNVFIVSTRSILSLYKIGIFWLGIHFVHRREGRGVKDDLRGGKEAGMNLRSNIRKRGERQMAE